MGSAATCTRNCASVRRPSGSPNGAITSLGDILVPTAFGQAQLRAGPEIYDPKVTRAIVVCTPVLQTAIPPPQHAQPVGPKQVPLAELAPGMVLLTDLNTRDGMLILGKDARLTGAQIQRIRNFAQLTPIAEPILVELPR